MIFRALVLTAMIVCVVSVNANALTESLSDLNQDIVSLYNQKRYDEAMAVAKKALALSRANYSANHIQTAILKTSIGNLYCATGEFDEATKYYAQALTAVEALYGSDNTNVALELDNLARAYEGKKEWDNALGSLARAEGIREKSFGKMSPEAADTQVAMARNYFLMGQAETAERTYRLALLSYKKEFGAFHSKIARPQQLLLTPLEAQMDAAQSTAILRRVLVIEESVLGKKHPNIALILERLGTAYIKASNGTEAENAFKRAVEIQSKGATKGTADYVYCLAQLGAVNEQKGDLGVASYYYETALSESEKLYGSYSPKLMHSIEALLRIYEKMGNTTKQRLLLGKKKMIQDKSQKSKASPTPRSSAFFRIQAADAMS